MIKTGNKLCPHVGAVGLNLVVDNVDENIRWEADFLHEANNMELARRDFSSFGDQVHVPTVYHDLTTKRVLTMEWIDGVKFSDTTALTKLHFTVAAVMTTLVEALSHQVFVSGRVHGDPHPGNIFIRPQPHRPSRHQVVILDHGMYIEESEAFRQDYCRLWKAMVLMDSEVLNDVCKRLVYGPGWHSRHFALH